MVAQDVATLLAGSATLVQLVAAVPVLLLLRRRPLPLLSPVVIAAFSLMVFRRALAAAAWPEVRAGTGMAVTHEAAGLGISVALGLAIIVLWRVSSTPAVTECPEAPSVGTGATQVASAREQERELLCYDLHDGLAQLVMGSRMHLEAFKAARGENTERAERELGLMSHCLEEAVDEVTRIISDLHLTVCPDVSLSEAVQRYLDKLVRTHGWECEFDDRTGQRRFPTAVESMVCRLIQEALNNAAKHARADRVRVSLRVGEGALVAVVEDSGCGFEPEQMEWNTRRIGLRGMCGRARLVGGSCKIESAPGKGTKVTSRVPCRAAEMGDE